MVTQQHVRRTRSARVSAEGPELAPAPEPGSEAEPETASPTPVVAGLAVRRAGTVDSDDPLGGSAAAPDVVQALQRRRGSGAKLPGQVADQFGSQLGVNLANVRVHADSEASDLARSVQAKAFTHGSDIYFSQGTYAPGTRSGQHLLAHELAHVAQQRNGAAKSGSTTIGRANDPAEADADRTADRVVGALQRRAANQPAQSTPTGPGTSPGDGEIQRFLGLGKKTAKKDFAKAVKGKKPADEAEAKTRMETLRATLKALTSEERETIASDPKLMAKARKFVGDHEYMSLVTAVGMAYKPKKKKPKKGAAAPPTGPQHMSGKEADAFIRTEMAKLGHLNSFITTAVDAGKQAEGFVATVGDDDWAAIYDEQYSAWGEKAGVDDANTNAFIANQHTDRPAIIHHERGTRSTAIHESMHRYSELTVLRSIGSGLNEGITEYFTRLITDKDGNPTNGSPSNRTNYQSNWRFVSDLVNMLGDTEIAGQTELAKIYFSGELARLKTRFEAKCSAAQLSGEDTATRWGEFEAALKSGAWDEARAKFPPPPAPPTPVTPPTPEATTPTTASPEATPPTGGTATVAPSTSPATATATPTPVTAGAGT